MALIDMQSEITDLVPALGRVRARKLINRSWKYVQDSCLWSVASKLALEFLSRLPICSVRKLCGRKATKPNTLSVVEYLGCPRLSRFAPVGTLKAGPIIALAAGICLLFVSSGGPQIVSPVVESVMIFMIALAAIPILKPEDLTVHPYLNARLTGNAGELSTGIETLSVVIPVSVPRPLREKFKILCVDFCHLVLRERNKTVRLIQRLNNRLAVHATFGHDSTSNGIAVFSRFSIVSGGQQWRS